MKLLLYYIGKARDEHANAIAAEYLRRSGRWSDCTMREINPLRFDIFERHPTARKILLDPGGRSWTTERFVTLISDAENTGTELIFLIGGHNGLPVAWKQRADILLSLSPMTFPHELARSMLAEQIYRAFTTLRGHPYPR